MRAGTGMEDLTVRPARMYDRNSNKTGMIKFFKSKLRNIKLASSLKGHYCATEHGHYD